MKLVTKNNYKFATGMFWQIPNDGKRNINLNKLARDTKHNMFCYIKTINPTWGFCHKDEMQGEKNVASLGKFIIQASKLSAGYSNSIICFKFKSIGELGDDGRKLDSDLYGYIVLLNGTICPEDGEYVSTFEMVRGSIIEKARKHEIETLYLPFEVSLQLFSIFEVLLDVRHQDELLLKIIHNLSPGHKSSLRNFILQDLSGNKKYLEVIDDQFTTEIFVLQQLVEEQAFEQKLKAAKEQDLKYLIPNIYILAYTSDEIYWQNEQFKMQFNKALIGSITKQTNQKYKLGILVVLVGIIVFFIYNILKHQEIKHHILANAAIPRAIAVVPIKLITPCLIDNDRFFKDLGTWSLTGLKCNSLGAVLTFNSDSDTTLGRFADLVGKNDKSIRLNGKVGTYSIEYKINSTAIVAASKEKILEQLQQAVIDYDLKISLPHQSPQSSLKTINKFSITSKQSPIFLFSHHVLDNVRLFEISMAFERSTGFYTWMLQGEF